MLYEALKQRAADGNPIRVAASGAGWMGSGFAAQMAHVPGMELSVIIDPDLDKAHAAFLATGLAARDGRIGDVGTAMDAIRQGRRHHNRCRHGCPTGRHRRHDRRDTVPASGAETAFQAIQHGKDVVLINIEADVTVGRILKTGGRCRCTLPVSSGDEPGCLMELVEYVKLLGFEPIVIGKGQNNPSIRLPRPTPSLKRLGEPTRTPTKPHRTSMARRRCSR